MPSAIWEGCIDLDCLPPAACHLPEVPQATRGNVGLDQFEAFFVNPSLSTLKIEARAPPSTSPFFIHLHHTQLFLSHADNLAITCTANGLNNPFTNCSTQSFCTCAISSSRDRKNEMADISSEMAVVYSEMADVHGEMADISEMADFDSNTADACGDSHFRGVLRTWRGLPSTSTYLVLAIVGTVLLWLFQEPVTRASLWVIQDMPRTDVYLTPINTDMLAETRVDPINWLRQNTRQNNQLTAYPTSSASNRPKAAFISLVRNSEVNGMVQSIAQLEARFNSHPSHQYDWIFFNNEDFDDEFKAAITNATASNVFFEKIPKAHWSMPSWIEQSRFDVGREFLTRIGVGKAWLESYHHMCRWNSGFFALENRLRDYDWYWRVEPSVRFTCDIEYDVFRFMQDNDLVYGFNMAILDDARSFPSLGKRTEEFRSRHSDMVHPRSDTKWLLHERGDDTIIRSPKYEPSTDGEYNNCQFYSNFEIGSLKFFRGKEHQAYFNYLDKAGGFFYERYGDAPVHTLSVSMFVPKSRVWFFRDIGYAHGICEQCPPHTAELELDDMPRPAPYSEHLRQRQQQFYDVTRDFERNKGVPGLRCGCTASALDINHSKLVPFESKQRKPLHTCIRQWLGGKWLTAETGYYPQGEKVTYGEGIGTYKLTGMESNPYDITPSISQGLEPQSST